MGSKQLASCGKGHVHSHNSVHRVATVSVLNGVKRALSYIFSRLVAVSHMIPSPSRKIKSFFVIAAGKNP